jgi:hypothetical protein
MQMKQMSDATIIDVIKQKAHLERELVTEILEYLREIELRRLHLARGFASLFEFCLKELKYSPAEAHVRIQAMRLIKALPEVESNLEGGSLSLSVAASIQGTFRRQEKLNGAPLDEEEKRVVVQSLLGSSTREAERKLVEFYPQAKIERESAKPVAEERTRIQFAASKELMVMLEQLKGLLAHKVPSGRFDQFFEEIAEIALKKLAPKPPTFPSDAHLLGAPKVNRGRSRYVKANTRRIVWAEGKDQCEYCDPVTGRRCESRHALQVDHIKEFAKGGSNDAQNLRLLCRAHNLWREEGRLAHPLKDIIQNIPTVLPRRLNKIH